MAKSLERISLCLVALQVAVAVSSAVECVGEGEGECWPVRNTCKDDHPNEWDHCFTLSTHQEHPWPTTDCQWPSWCSQVDSAAMAPLRPLHLTHTCTPLNPEQYNLSIMWDAPIIAHPTGYEVRLYKFNDFVPDYCFCLGPDTRSFTFAPIPYNKYYGSVTVEVTSLPFLDPTFSTISTTVSAPSNCRDLSPDSPLCGPPAYGEVRNVSVRMLWAHSSEEMELHVSWRPPLPLSSPLPNLPPPSVFYVMVQDSQTDYDLLCEIPESPCFKAINTTSVRVHSLNASRTYSISVQSYQNCSGVRQEGGGRRGCGKAFNAITVEPLPLPHPMLTTSPLATTTPTTVCKSYELSEASHKQSSLVYHVVDPTPTPSPTNSPTARSHLSRSAVVVLAVVSVVLVVLGVLLLIVVLTVTGLQCHHTKKTSTVPPEKLELQNFANPSDDGIPADESVCVHEGEPNSVGTSPSCFGAPPPRSLASVHEGEPHCVGTSPSCFGAPPPRSLASVHESEPNCVGNSPSCFGAPPPRSLASVHEGELDCVGTSPSCFGTQPPRSLASVHEGELDCVGTSPSCFGAPPPRSLASVHESEPNCVGNSPSCFGAPPPRSLASVHESEPNFVGTSPSYFNALPLAVDTSHREGEPDGASPSCIKPPLPKVLVVYSLNSPKKEEKLVLRYLVEVLRTQYGILATSYILEERTPPTDWTVQEFEGAAAVLCVCNRPFWQEWEGQNSGMKCCAVVRTLKQLFHGTVANGQDLKREKIAVVRLYSSHSQYIPLLLQNCRNYVVTDSEEIARFVIKQSPYRAPPVLS